MKIFCIGRNYHAHIAELNNAIPDAPVIFMKPKSALARHNFPIKYPSFSDNVHYEAEIVIKIDKNGKNIPLEEAHTYYNEWTLGIDFTARDIQDSLKHKGLPWEIAKGFDHSAYVGTFLPIADKSAPADFEFYLNEELKQEGDTSLMIYSFDQIIHHISKYFSLQIGDLIFTGTPSGVGPVLPYDTVKGVLNGNEVFENFIK